MLTPQSAIDNWGRDDDETKIDSMPERAHHAQTQPLRQVPVQPTGLIGLVRSTTRLPLVKPISGHRSMFQRRVRALWDWFRLSCILLFFIFILLAGGLAMSKALIVIWETWLHGYFS